MEQIKIFSDERYNLVCTYCGEGLPETRDHVPSKILLDEPFPTNLPVVTCCEKCNYKFSLDEEYFASIIECAVWGTTDINVLSREKIKRSLSRNHELQNRIETSFTEIEGEKNIIIEEDRFKNILIMLY